jgi:hypothetical protein
MANDFDLERILARLLQVVEMMEENQRVMLATLAEHREDEFEVADAKVAGALDRSWDAFRDEHPELSTRS